VTFISNKWSTASSFLVDCPMLFGIKGLQECSHLLESLEDVTAFAGNLMQRCLHKLSHSLQLVFLSCYCCEFHTEQVKPSFASVG
jgi:hypothetical protein